MLHWLVRGAMLLTFAFTVAVLNGCASTGADSSPQPKQHHDDDGWGCRPFCAGFSA